MSTATGLATASDRLQRVCETTTAIAIWIVLGFLFKMTTSEYQMTGLALVLMFQVAVRRQPLRTLWVRDADSFRLDGFGWMIALLLAVFPAFHVIQDLRATTPLIRTLAHCAAMAGAFPAAFALRRFERATTRALLGCMVIPGIIGIAMMWAGAFASHTVAVRTLYEKLWIGMDSFLVYVPVVFVFEEVAFRGAFDSHIHHAGDSHPWLSALYVSVLWGLWHVPVTLANAPLPRLVLNNVLVCCIIGVPFSMWWRRSNNLAVTGVSHAFVDAVRNALLVMKLQ